MKILDDRNVGCGIFSEFRENIWYWWTWKSLILLKILLSKLAHYSARGLANDWFKSYLSNIKQYASIIGYNSNLADLKIGVSQGLILGPLLFLIFINDLKQARMSNSVMSITLRMTQT